MRISIAAFALIAGLAATPLAAFAQTATPARTIAHYDVVDNAGRVVGELVAGPNQTLVLTPASAMPATIAIAPRPDTFRIDYSKALTPQQFDDAYRAAHDSFFDVEHMP